MKYAFRPITDNEATIIDNSYIFTLNVDGYVGLYEVIELDRINCNDLIMEVENSEILTGHTIFGLNKGNIL